MEDRQVYTHSCASSVFPPGTCNVPVSCFFHSFSFFYLFLSVTLKSLILILHEYWSCLKWTVFCCVFLSWCFLDSTIVELCVSSQLGTKMLYVILLFFSCFKLTFYFCNAVPLSYQLIITNFVQPTFYKSEIVFCISMLIVIKVLLFFKKKLNWNDKL